MKRKLPMSSPGRQVLTYNSVHRAALQPPLFCVCCYFSRSASGRSGRRSFRITSYFNTTRVGPTRPVARGLCRWGAAQWLGPGRGRRDWRKDRKQ